MVDSVPAYLMEEVFRSTSITGKYMGCILLLSCLLKFVAILKHSNLAEAFSQHVNTRNSVMNIAMLYLPFFMEFRLMHRY